MPTVASLLRLTALFPVAQLPVSVQEPVYLVVLSPQQAPLLWLTLRLPQVLTLSEALLLMIRVV